MNQLNMKNLDIDNIGEQLGLGDPIVLIQTIVLKLINLQTLDESQQRGCECL